MIDLFSGECLRSGAKDMKSSQQYPQLFGEHVAGLHSEYMKSAARYE